MENDPTFLQTEINSQKPIYFIHPHNKFWEVSLNSQNVEYRAGKIKNGTQITSQKLQKRYSSDYVAKRTVKEKIREKLVKGYIIFQGTKPEKSTTNSKSLDLVQENLNFAKQTPNQLKQTSNPVKENLTNKLAEKIPQVETYDDKVSKKEQKQQKKKIKNVIEQLQQRNRLNTSNPSTTLSMEQRHQNQLIILQGNISSPKGDSTYLINIKTGQAIDYELMEENKIKITKLLSEQSCGFQIKTFGSKEETMKFLFGQREWLKSQGYTQSQNKIKSNTLTKPDPQSAQKTPIIKAQSTTNNKKKAKSGSLVARTDECLAPLSKLKNFNNDPPNNKQEPKLGPPSTGVHIKLMLAETWKQGVDPKGWLISQKLDGVRCHWTGTQMFSRNGNKFVFPNFFVKNWPKAQLDGQLFNGRGKFKHTISCVKRLKPDCQLWANVRFLVFDAPGLQCSFKDRYRIMKEVIQKIDNPYIKCHFHRQCKGFKDMFSELDQINHEQGQGIMLRDPNSLYEFKRSKALLKVKTFHDDEATIIGYNEGTGKFVGHIGSLRCVNSLGAHFDVGSGLNDEMRYNPPKIGQKLVYKYQELNKETGRPRFPTFLRMFEDETATQGESVMGWVKDGEDEDD